METCFGYWVPRAVDDKLLASLQKVGQGKRARLLELRDVLEHTGTKALARRYDEYVEAVRSLLVKNSVKFQKHLEALRRDPFAPSGFRSFLDRVLTCLRSEDYINRLCLPFVKGVMPELWDDPLAFLDFESSFFQYVEYVAQRPMKSFVPGKILALIDLSDRSPDAEQIKAALKRHLGSIGWMDSNW